MRNSVLFLTLFSAFAMQALADGEADTFHADYYPQLANTQKRLQAVPQDEKKENDDVDTRILPPGIYDEEPEGLPEGYLCIDKIVTMDQIVYDEELQCHHVKQKSCFQQVQTLYKQATVEECNEIFKKDCFYQYVDVAKKQKVKICQDSFSRNCSATEKDKVCTIKSHSVCETSYPEHNLVEDAPNCNETSIEWCEPDLDGNQVCVDVPKKECSIAKVRTTKVTPLTDCKQVDIEVCGYEKCPIEKGPRVCRDEVKTVVTEVPEETCDIVPKKECNDVVKVIPSLTTVDHCEDIPKEVCTKVRINPRKESKPHKKKWCGRREDILAASTGEQFFSSTTTPSPTTQ